MRAALPLLAMVPLLAACGFEPLYAERTGVGPALSAVQVADTPQTRLGFLMREQLGNAFARSDAPARYRLSVTTRVVRAARGVRVNNVASRYELDVTVGYTLTEAATNRVATQGSTLVQVSYASADPPYAGLQAEQDAEERAATQAAVQLRLELSRWFAAHPGV